MRQFRSIYIFVQQSHARFYFIHFRFVFCFLSLQNMYSLVCFLVLGLFISNCHCRAIEEPDNAIQSDDNQYTGGRDWVKISDAPPPKIVQQIGSPVELECEVSGSPAPTVHWVRGNKPIDSVSTFCCYKLKHIAPAQHQTTANMIKIENLFSFFDLQFPEIDSNAVTEISPNSLVRVRSRLIIDHMAVPERAFTCVGRSGSKMTYATTTVYASPASPPNVTDMLRANTNSLLGPKKARIVLYYNAIFDAIGRNVVLPCKTVGRPHPEVYWMDTENNIVDSDNDRYKVLPTGELQITSVRWSDMGLFTCIARNAVSKDSISTFLYPMMVSNRHHCSTAQMSQILKQFY